MTPETSPTVYLKTLADEFRHLQNEAAREGQHSRWERRQRQRMLSLMERFDSTLHHWVHEPSRQQQWRQYFRDGGEPPPPVEPERFLYYKARSADAGALIEVRAAPAGGYDVLIEGVLTERLPASYDINAIDPIALFGRSAGELFEVDDACIEALDRYLNDGEVPNSRCLQQLVSEGILDFAFGLTARGKRLRSEM